jgi:hypothetical protein|tara:strand:+ start:206 stop:508 length:303 start_codon:yes stop_codon:yes gene_type:complete
MPLDKQKDMLLDLFEEVLSGLDSKGDGKEDKALPYQMLNFPDGKDLYVLDPVKKRMVRAKHNTEIVQISVPDKNDKVIVRSSAGNFLFIPLEYVQDIGFN